MFSKRETIQGLRRFLYIGAFWGGYSQIPAVTGFVFTGFALKVLGLSEVHIAALASVVALAGLVTPFSLLLSNRIERKRRFLVSVGFVEIALVTSVAAIPLLVPTSLWMPVLVAMLLVGTTMGYAVLPIYGGWLATMVPEDIRARYLGRRMTVVVVAAAVVGYSSGRFLDVVQGYPGFVALFAFGFVLGIAGYLTLLGIASPEGREEQPTMGLWGIVATPLRDASFRRYLLFYGLWHFSATLAMPFYSVFMLKTLSIPFSRVAIINALSMIAQVAAYRLWGSVSDRCGSKAVLQALLVPRMLTPVLWVFATPTNYMIVLPAVAVFSGVMFSGLGVSAESLMYGLLPKPGQKPMYFAGWTFFNSLVGVIGPAIGGILVAQLEPVRVGISPSWQIGHLQVMFLISAALMILPNLAIRGVSQGEAARPGYSLSQLRQGNPLAFAYNLYLFSRTAGESKRAQAARAMGRSRSPMAVDRLSAALGDLSPEVRSQAAKGLGETKSPDAVEPLVRELSDEESDVRPEAAEALGHLPEARATEALYTALEDSDSRVRISAIRALAIMGGPEVRRRLFRRFSGPFDRATFPALVDALSRLGDHRIVLPTLEGLKHYRSPVIRLQLLNGVCRTLVAKDLFYKLLLRDELEQTQQIRRMLQRGLKSLSGSRTTDTQMKADAVRLVAQLIEHFDLEQTSEMSKVVGQVADRLRLHSEHIARGVESDASGCESAPTLARINTCLDAIQTFLKSSVTQEIHQQGWTFLVVCLAQAIELVTEYDKKQRPNAT